MLAPVQEDEMNFLNLLWAIRHRRLTHYEVCKLIGMETSRFSRCLNGRLEFTPIERERLVKLFGYDENWLFAQPLPKLVDHKPTAELATV